MTGDESGQDAVRVPGDDNAESSRRGARAMAKKVAGKVTKKPRQKKPARKATTTARKTTRKVAKTATRTGKPVASAASGTERTETPVAASATDRAPEAGATSDAAPATGAAAAPSARPASQGAAPAAGLSPSTPAAAAIEAPRPPAPMHPGAPMDAAQEHAGGIGGLLALWGPLIIVGFLVLIFRGSDERDGAGAGGADAVTQTAGMQVYRPGSAVASPRLPAPPGFVTDPSGAAAGASDGFDRAARSGGQAMPTSMAGAPAFATGAAPPPGAPRIAYPPPSGPYRNPWGGSMGAGESWPAAGTGDGRWTGAGRSGTAFRDDGGSQTPWVRCAPPYYWCPAPKNPAW